MKTSKLCSSALAIAGLAAGGVLLAPLQVQAQSTWNTSTGNWSVSTNWLGGLPTSGSTTSIVIAATASGGTTTNNIGAFTLNSLTFSGANNITLAGASALNFANNGATAPTLAYYDTNTAAGSSITCGITIATGATLSVTGTNIAASNSRQLSFGGVISGDGGISVSSSGVGLETIFAFTKANTFTGGFTLNSGRVAVTVNNALGTGTITLNGGSLRSSSSTAYSLSNAVVLGTSVGFGDSAAPGNGTKTLTLTGTTTLNSATGTSTVTLWENTASVIGADFQGPIINGSLGTQLAFNGTGTVLFDGASSNTYTGTTSVTGSSTTLQLGKTGSATAIAGNLTIAAGKVQLTQSNQIATSSVVTVSGTSSAAAILDLNGKNQTIGALNTGGSVASSSALITLGSGTLTLAGDYTYVAGSSASGAVISGAGVLNFGSANRTFNVGHVSGASADTTISSTVEGTGYTLNKTGSGILALNGTSNVNATVSAGELSVNSLLNGGVAVSSGATLSGIGSVTGSVTADSATIKGNNLSLGATSLTGSSNLNGYNIANSVAVVGGTTALTGTTKSTSTLTVSTGATLDNNGTVDGNVSVNSGLLKGSGHITGNLALVGGTLTPGNSAGTTTVDGNLTMDSASKLVLEVSGTTAGTTFDQIGVSGNLSLAGTLDLSTLSGLTLGDIITLVDNTGTGTTTGFFSSIITSGTTLAITGATSTYAFTVDNTNYLLNCSAISGSDLIANDVTLSVVPEPSTWAMLVGGLGMLAFGQRFRRR